MVIGLLAASLAGCTNDGCQSGADSAEAAVSELLAAAATGDASRACQVTGSLSEDDLQSNLDEIGAFVAGAGGIDRLLVENNLTKQMGSWLVVEVQVADSPEIVEFNVWQSGGKYFVGIGNLGNPDAADEPTTAPWPPLSRTHSNLNGMNDSTLHAMVRVHHVVAWYVGSPPCLQAPVSAPRGQRELL